MAGFRNCTSRLVPSVPRGGTNDVIDQVWRKAFNGGQTSPVRVPLQGERAQDPASRWLNPAGFEINAGVRGDTEPGCETGRQEEVLGPQRAHRSCGEGC